jgi:TonB family protein
MQRLFSLLLIVVWFTSFGQKTKEYFVDRHGIKTDESNAEYIRKVTKQGDLYNVQEFFMNGLIHSDLNYKDKKLSYKIDTLKCYYLNGVLSTIGSFSNNEKHGEWKWFFVSGKPCVIGNYLNGKQTGTWEWFDEKGNSYKLENANDSLIKCFHHYSEFPGGQFELLNYLKNINYPPSAIRDGIEGTVYTSFYINTNGKVEDINIMKGVSSELNSTVYEYLKNMPAWSIGYKYGKPVREQFFLPVRFSMYGMKTTLMAQRQYSGYLFSSALQDYQNENYKEAIHKLKTAISINYLDSRYYYYLGNCHDKLNEKEIACGYWQIANVLDEKNINEKIKTDCIF